MPSRSRTARNFGLALALGLAPASFAPWPEAQGQVPGRDAFSRDPKSPLETWEVASYLIRIGQPAQAAPYIKRFLDSKPDDATLLKVRDTYGVGSLLSLSDDPATRPYARPIADLLAGASTRNATDPARLDKSIAGLGQTAEERRYAIERLREAGPYAVPPMVRALVTAGLDQSGRTALAGALGHLEPRAVPALIAALDSPDAALVGDVALALGRIGDRRAIPALTYLVARPNSLSTARPAAAASLYEITGKAPGSQPQAPVRVLAEEAKRYLDHAVRFPGDPVVLWLWDDAGQAPAPVTASVRDAEAVLGLRAAKEALDLDPNDSEAKVLQISLGLDHAPEAWRAPALAAGPATLGLVVDRAIRGRRGDLAVAAIPILGRLSSRNDLLPGDRRNALVDGLGSPDRRVQFASAEALIGLDPRASFAGSSRVVPTLARFVSATSTPRALVIDGNAERASQVSGFLKSLGFDARTVATGALGFTEAADSADIELIAIDPNLPNDSWRLADILGNLKADPRTSGIPVFLVGPLDLHDQLNASLESFPDVRFLVTPTETTLFRTQIDRGLASLGIRGLTTAERADYAKRASALLAQVARSPGSPFEGDLPLAAPALAQALGGTTAVLESAEALGDVPGPEAQRVLSDAALDASRPAPVRVAMAGSLARNVRRFGGKLESSQEKRLLQELGGEADPALREALAAVVGALRPGPDASASLVAPAGQPSRP